jgi:hypothetical protein
MDDVSEIMPGDRVTVFDSRLFIDDVTTPLCVTLRATVVVRRYGVKALVLGHSVAYPDLCDVIFDYDPGKMSFGHFTYGIKKDDSANGERE